MSTRRKLPRLAAVLACATAVVLSGCTGSSDDGDGKYRFDSATAIGTVIPKDDRKDAPALTAELLDGTGKMSLARQKGKVVVLAFWASWCPPCRVEMPQLDGLNDELAGQGVTFVGVDSRDDTGNAKEFLRNNKIGFPSVVDSTGALAQKLGNIPAGLPFTIVVDKTGKVAAAYVARYGAKDLEGALTTLRGET